MNEYLSSFSKKNYFEFMGPVSTLSSSPVSFAYVMLLLLHDQNRPYLVGTLLCSYDLFGSYNTLALVQ